MEHVGTAQLHEQAANFHPRPNGIAVLSYCSRPLSSWAPATNSMSLSVKLTVAGQKRRGLGHRQR
jgi:hypothetical protein